MKKLSMGKENEDNDAKDKKSGAKAEKGNKDGGNTQSLTLNEERHSIFVRVKHTCKDAAPSKTSRSWPGR